MWGKGRFGIKYFCLLARAVQGFDLLEEVIALVVHQDECGEVFYFDLPDGFHAQFGELYAFDVLDVVLRQDSSGAND